MRNSGWRAVAVAVVAVTALAGCGGGLSTLTPSPTAAGPTASTANAAGAVNGFLQAASQQDNGRVLTWLASPADMTHLNELLKVYTDFGTAGGFFWNVAGVSATGQRGVDATHVDVALSGPIDWCLGRAPNDPGATCSEVTGVTGLQDTYVAVSVGGEWKVDVDVDASTGLDHNPRASPTATAPSPTPT